ncbi:MAG: tRNA epoxyqueuosine(34) reductase QueG [Opitutales bacterium]
MDEQAMKQELVARAKALGFDVCGVAPVDAALRAEYFRQWIAEGQHGEMRWLERNNDRRLQPANLLDEARSIVMVGLNYYQPDPSGRAYRIAKYALGKDYHRVLLKKLKQLCVWMREHGGAQKPYVDTGPVLEKPLGVAAGLGWQGKSTILLNEAQGTWLFLGTIVTTLPFAPDAAPADRCGTCTRCLEACPTQAITGPYQLDARRCLSYLTIEHKGAIPEAYRRALGNRVFGCDECLDVCPWNRHAQRTREAKFVARELPDLRTMLGWDAAAFEAHFAGTPIQRTGLSRWKRNVCVVLGNVGTAADLHALQAAVAGTDALVAEHARWAITEIHLRVE